MPGHVKRGGTGEPDPDPSPFLFVSWEDKQNDMDNKSAMSKFIRRLSKRPDGYCI